MCNAIVADVTCRSFLDGLAPGAQHRWRQCPVRYSRRVQLNEDKTELLWFASATYLRQLPRQGPSLSTTASSSQWPSFTIAACGSILNCQYANTSHASLRPVFSISVRRQPGRDVSVRLVSALVLSRLDYCNAVLAGLGFMGFGL